MSVDLCPVCGGTTADHERDGWRCSGHVEPAKPVRPVREGQRLFDAALVAYGEACARWAATGMKEEGVEWERVESTRQRARTLHFNAVGEIARLLAQISKQQRG